MVASEAVARIRSALGPVGVIVGLGGPEPDPDIAAQLDGVRRLEGAGYRALWTNEVIGADALVRVALWLAATERLVVGTSIANMWVRPPQTAHAAATQLAEAYPGRFVLGLGAGYPAQAAAVGRDFVSPVATARSYLSAMGAAAYPRILAANGPKMLATAAELADGVLPAGAPPSTTSAARGAVGDDGLVVVFVPHQVTDDAGPVVEAIEAHLAAGADHVIVGTSYTTAFGVAVDHLLQLAPSIAAFGA